MRFTLRGTCWRRKQKVGALRPDVPPHNLYLALLQHAHWGVFLVSPRPSSSRATRQAFHSSILKAQRALKNATPCVLTPAQAQENTPRKPGWLRGNGNSTPDLMLEPCRCPLCKQKVYARPTSTREIAAGLGCASLVLLPTIETKEDLLYAICDRPLGRIRRDVESALAGAGLRSPRAVEPLVDAPNKSPSLLSSIRHAFPVDIGGYGTQHLSPPEVASRNSQLFRERIWDLVRRVCRSSRAA